MGPTRRVARLLKPKPGADGKRKTERILSAAEGVAGVPRRPDARDTPRDTPSGRRYQCRAPGGHVEDQEVVMKRIRVARARATAWPTAAVCAALALGAGQGSGPLWAASPQVEKAIKAIDAVANDPDRLKLFCELNGVLQEAGDKEDEATSKQIDDLIARIGADFGAAWDVGDELSETSPDGQEFYAAVDNLADKCQ
jgi:hypothetical protein